MSALSGQESELIGGVGTMRRLKRYLPSDIDRVLHELRAIKGVTKKRARQFVAGVYDLNNEEAVSLMDGPQSFQAADNVCVTGILDQTIELCGICGGKKKEEKCKSKAQSACKPKRKAKKCCPPAKSSQRPCKHSAKPAGKPANEPPCEPHQNFSASSVLSAASEPN